ncbi:MAG: PQQ-binding-like beta-propeller repeat protein [Bacteroidota bacterium]|nr:PQQ-binding-like beta-propeller repeat protein [Bacteroidota bacterium]
MKRFLLPLLLISSAILFAQPKFPVAYEAKFPIKADGIKTFSYDHDLIIIANDEEAAAMKTEDGSPVWTVNYANSLGEEELAWKRHFPKSHVLLVYSEASKKKPCHKFFLDDRSGELLWKTSEMGDLESFETAIRPYFTDTVQGFTDPTSGNFIDLRTGKTVPSPICDLRIYEGNDYQAKFRNVLENGDILRVDVAFKITSDMGKVRVTRIKNCNVTWQQQYDLKAVQKLCGSKLASGKWFNYNTHAAAVYVDAILKGDILFVVGEGIVAIDLKNGNVLWTTTFDTSDKSFGLTAKQTLHMASIPVITDDAIFLADLSKGEKVIKRLDLKSGKEVWRSSELKKDDVVPNMGLVDGVLICQLGGYLLQEVMNGNGDCMIKNDLKGNYGILALDPETGQELWNTQKMKKQLTDDFGDKISNIVLEKNTVFAFGKKALMALDPKTGKEIRSTEIKKLKTGDAILLEYDKDNDQLLIVAEEGLSSVNPNSGTLNFSTRVDKYLLGVTYGTLDLIWVGKDGNDLREFVQINRKNGELLAKQKDTPYPHFAPDGSYFIVFDKKTATRFNTF